MRSGPLEVLNAVWAGVQVDPHQYEFQLYIFLETGDER
jgi:hypothetical protein